MSTTKVTLMLSCDTHTHTHTHTRTDYATWTTNRRRGAMLAVYATGVVIYLLYGIRHSVAAKSLQHVPDEQRILLPDDDHVTELSDDVTSGSGLRLTGNSLRDVNAMTATPLRL